MRWVLVAAVVVAVIAFLATDFRQNDAQNARQREPLAGIETPAWAERPWLIGLGAFAAAVVGGSVVLIAVNSSPRRD